MQKDDQKGRAETTEGGVGQLRNSSEVPRGITHRSNKPCTSETSAMAEPWVDTGVTVVAVDTATGVWEHRDWLVPQPEGEEQDGVSSEKRGQWVRLR